MSIEGNEMQLKEVRDWLERGSSARDAAVGLFFTALDSGFDSIVYERSMRAAEFCIQLEYADQLREIRDAIETL